jgi:hypothetical protein
MTVTSSGCNSGTRWTTTPGIEGSVRGSSPEPGTVMWIGSMSDGLMP